MEPDLDLAREARARTVVDVLDRQIADLTRRIANEDGQGAVQAATTDQDHELHKLLADRSLAASGDHEQIDRIKRTWMTEAGGADHG